MDQVVCSCVKCAERLGEFINLWTKIGKSYISPVINNEDGSRISPAGPVRLGEENTLIDHCRLQDVSCANCRAVVGLRCLETPVNHVLQQGQLFLRFSSVVITAAHSGDHVGINIQRTLKLKEAPRNGFNVASTPPASEGSTFMNDNGSSEMHGQLLHDLQVQLDAQTEETRRLNRAGYQMVSSFDSAMLRIEGEIKRLKDSLEGIGRDLEGYNSKSANMADDVVSLRSEFSKTKNASPDKSACTHLEQELASTKQTLADMRLSLSSSIDKSAEEQQHKHDILALDLTSTQRELRRMREELDETKEAAREGVLTAEAYAKEVSSLRIEVRELRGELAQERSRRSYPSNSGFPTEEIDILTTNITRIGQRASQVETIQMEFRLLKGRVQRLERAQIPDGQDTTEPSPQYKNPIQSQLGPPRSKRRRSPQPEENTNVEKLSCTSTTERSIQAPWPSSPPGNHDFTSSPPPRMQKLDIVAPDPPRLTKSGTTDKRYLKRGPRQAITQDQDSNG